MHIVNGRRAACVALLSYSMVALPLGGCRKSNPHTECARFVAKSGIVLILYVDASWEVSRGLYYSIVDGEYQIPVTYIGNLADPCDVPAFSMLESRDNGSEVVGVVDRSNPTVLLLAYSGRAHASWPYNMDSSGILELVALLEQGQGELVLYDGSAIGDGGT